MSKIYTPEDLYKGFAQAHPELTSDIPMTTLRKIIRGEFALMKEVMDSGSLEEVRLQYLFVMRVSPQKVMKHLRLMYLKPRHRKHVKDVNMLLDYVNNNKDKFKKIKDYESRITKYTGYTTREIDTRQYIDNGYKQSS